MTEILLQAATYFIDACHDAKFQCAIAVHNRYGEPLLELNTKGSLPLIQLVARTKSYTSAMYRMSTEQFGAFTQPGKPFYGLNAMQVDTGMQFTQLPGGYPIYINGKFFGGVGTSDLALSSKTRVYKMDKFNREASMHVAKLIQQMAETNKPIYNLDTHGLDKNGQTIFPSIGFIHAAHETFKLLDGHPDMRMGLVVMGSAEGTDGLLMSADIMSHLPLFLSNKAKIDIIQKFPYHPFANMQSRFLPKFYKEPKTIVSIAHYKKGKGLLDAKPDNRYINTFYNAFSKTVNQVCDAVPGEHL